MLKAASAEQVIGTVGILAAIHIGHLSDFLILIYSLRNTKPHKFIVQRKGF
jgi:hypothetical protein